MSYETLKSKISTLISECADKITQRGRLAEILTSKGVTADKSETLENLVDKTSTIESGEAFKKMFKNYCCTLTRGQFDCEVVEETDIIPEYIFKDCSNLSWDKLWWGTVEIGQNAFEGCRSLALSELPKGLRSIGSNAFKGCKSITISEIPEGITKLVNTEFQNCSSIQSISGIGITFIGQQVFSGNMSLEEMYFPNCTTLQGYISNTQPSKIKKATFGALTSTNADTFFTFNALEELNVGEGTTASLYLQRCTNLTLESLFNIIVNLADMTGKTAPMLFLGSANLEKLSDEILNILDEKNWEYQ